VFGGSLMKKIIYSLPIIIVGIIIFLILKRADLFGVPITYKNVTHHGIALDVPDNYTESYNTSDGERIYYNKAKSLQIAIEASEGVDITIDEYIDYVRQMLMTGSYKAGNRTVSYKNNNISDILILDYIIDSKEKGKLTYKYNYIEKEGKRSITEKLFFIIKDNKITQVRIAFETDKKERLQEIIDHVAESISLK
jgi:hypothetical protein